jgi:hypothetical protein
VAGTAAAAGELGFSSAPSAPQIVSVTTTIDESRQAIR